MHSAIAYAPSAPRAAPAGADIELRASAAGPMIWVSPASGSPCVLSAGLRRYAGPAASDACASGILSLVHPHDRPAVRARWSDATKTGCTWWMRYRIRGAAGKYATVDATAEPVRDSSGSLAAWVGTWVPTSGSAPEYGLTRREFDVLRLAAAGHSGPAAARALGISPSTAKTHFENVYKKLGVSDRAAAVAVAFRAGLIN